MKRKHSLVLFPLLGLSMALTACGSDDGGSDDSSSGSDSGSSEAAGKIGVILPDTESSVRWESADRPARAWWTAMEPEERPSKTQRKKAMHELQSLGERLVALNAEQLARVELPELLREAVQEAARVKGHESRRRQMQYIGRLMRSVDPEPLERALAARPGQRPPRAKMPR